MLMYFETPPILTTDHVDPLSCLLGIYLKSKADTLPSRCNVVPRNTSLQHTWLLKRVWQRHLPARMSENESSPVHATGRLSSKP
jgi:hypothetical protein